MTFHFNTCDKQNTNILILQKLKILNVLIFSKSLKFLKIQCEIDVSIG